MRLRMNHQKDSWSWRWSAALTRSGPYRPVGHGTGEPSLRRRGEAAVGRRLSTASACARRVGLECRGSRPSRSPRRRRGRGARQRERQRVGHLMPALVAAEHRRQPSAQSAAVELHVRVGAERVEHLLALSVAELVEGQLVVVAHEVGPLAGDVERSVAAAGPWRSVGRRRGPWRGRCSAFR